MPFAIKCFLGLAVLASPCAYDADAHQPSITAIAAGISSPDALWRDRSIGYRVYRNAAMNQWK